MRQVTSFLITPNLYELLIEAYEKNPVKIVRHDSASQDTYPFSIEHVPASLDSFISSNKLFMLNKNLDAVYQRRTKRGYSKQTIYKIMRGEYPLNKDIVDLLSYYIFGVCYRDAVKSGKLPDNLKKYEQLSTDIDESSDQINKDTLNISDHVLEGISKLISQGEYDKAKEKITALTSAINKNEKKAIKQIVFRNSALNSNKAMTYVGNWQGTGEDINLAEHFGESSIPKHRYDADFEIDIVKDEIVVTGKITSRDYHTNEVKAENIDFNANGFLLNNNANLIYVVNRKSIFTAGVVSVKFIRTGFSEWFFITVRSGEEGRAFAKFTLRQVEN